VLIETDQHGAWSAGGLDKALANRSQAARRGCAQPVRVARFFVANIQTTKTPVGKSRRFCLRVPHYFRKIFKT
tara:strand:+ start:13418 stop:13636 length:219 start_codon:yes stop_codon:yes gene_type:complete